jgi:hypothetical protein
MLSAEGAFIEALTLGGPGSNSARNIAFDDAGNRYLGGYFEGQAMFPQGTVASAGGIDSYVVRLPQMTTTTAAVDAAIAVHTSTFRRSLRNPLDEAFDDYFALSWSP